MTTKEQERKALAQIRKIVESLGEGSYIGTAFEGCFEIAEENIENDFACSMKQRAESAEKEAAILKDKLTESEKDYEAAHAAAHEISEQKDTIIENLNQRVSQLEARRDELLKEVKDGADTAVQHWNKFREQEDRADRAEAEIIKLKAKLYDLLVTE